MTEKIQEIIDEISNLTVLELNELIKALEEKFGVSANLMVSAPIQTGGPAEQAPSGPSTVSIHLVDSGTNKLQVIKLLREINPNLSLKDAKDIADNPPQKIAENIDSTKAEELKKKFESAGAKVEIK